MLDSVRKTAQQFNITGTISSLEELKRGHIHSTFVSSWTENGKVRRYIHQCINRNVFPDPPQVMRNIEKVTAHLRGKVGASKEIEILEIIQTKKGESYLIDERGEYWRTYKYIENTKVFDSCTDPAVAYEAARAFSLFVSLLTDLSTSELAVTIPDYHHAVKRLNVFKAALKNDQLSRASDIKEEVQFINEREGRIGSIANHIEAGRLPLRIMHYDTKINNVLFGMDVRAKAVVDLDLVMPGSILYDFGDLVRSAVSKSAEDEEDLSKVKFERSIYDALYRGYNEAGAGYLTDFERSLFPESARAVAFTLAVRFLTDYLCGDTYFKTSKPKHNLLRARTQLKLVEEIERELM